MPALVVAMLGLAAMFGLILGNLSPNFWLLLPVVLAYAGWHVKQLLSPPWRVLRESPDHLLLLDRKDRIFLVQLEGGCFVSPMFLGFRCRTVADRKCRSVGLFRGQLAEPAFRRLSARLRQGTES